MILLLSKARANKDKVGRTPHGMASIPNEVIL